MKFHAMEPDNKVSISCTISCPQLDCKLMVGREHHLCYSELGTYLAQFGISSWCPDIVRLGISWAMDLLLLFSH